MTKRMSFQRGNIFDVQKIGLNPSHFPLAGGFDFSSIMNKGCHSSTGKAETTGVLAAAIITATTGTRDCRSRLARTAQEDQHYRIHQARHLFGERLRTQRSRLGTGLARAGNAWASACSQVLRTPSSVLQRR